MDYYGAPIGIFWDMDNCGVPKKFKKHEDICRKIEDGLKALGYLGTTSIVAYGNMELVAKGVVQALEKNKVTVKDIRKTSTGLKDEADKQLIIDMQIWASHHKIPSNILLISGDKDFVHVLNLLAGHNHRILLAHAHGEQTDKALINAASVEWDWDSLLAGKPPKKNKTRDILPPSVDELKDEIRYLQQENVFTTEVNIINAIRFRGKKAYPRNMVVAALNDAVTKENLFKFQRKQRDETIIVYGLDTQTPPMPHYSPNYIKILDTLKEFVPSEEGRKLKDSCLTCKGEEVDPFEFGVKLKATLGISGTLQDFLKAVDEMKKV